MKNARVASSVQSEPLVVYIDVSEQCKKVCLSDLSVPMAFEKIEEMVMNDRGLYSINVADMTKCSTNSCVIFCRMKLKWKM